MTVQPGLGQRVAALRRRLEQISPAAGEDGPAAVGPGVLRLQQVRHQIAQAQRQNVHLHAALDELTPAPHGSTPPLPRQLTWQARRLLLQGRNLLDQLKPLAGALAPAGAEEEELAAAYQQTLTMTEVALRSVQSFPESAADQLPLCEGVAGVLRVVADRVTGLRAVLQRRQAAEDRVSLLADLLVGLVQGRSLNGKPFQELAEKIVQETHPDGPLRFHRAPSDQPAQWAAAHALDVAQVMARLTASDTDYRGRPTDPVLAALVHDAGMAALPPDLLGRPGPLTDEQRRQIEAHVGLGTAAIQRLAPAEGWLADVVRTHHERLDGTGYPAGLAGVQVPRMSRFLAVCDVYVALANPRPHRPALSPRAALTETLLEAEKGRLDTDLAECLLSLSFYPVGTVVELADGCLGLVVASNPMRTDLTTPARPVVQLLAGEDGTPLPWPEHVNLAQSRGRHIVRSLTPEESRNLLGSRCWQLL